MNELRNDSAPLVPRSAGNNPVASPPSVSKRPLYWSVGALLFLLGTSLGFLLGGMDPFAGTTDGENGVVNIDRNEDHTSEAVDFGLFWDVWDTAQTMHISQPVNEEELLYGAIAGLVSGLNDPYSVFFTPEESKEFLGEISGSFSGIGAEIGLKHDQLTVIAPLPGSPAETAGLVPGDIILAIDELDTAFMSLNQAVEFIRGEVGTNVVLTVRREGRAEPFDLEVTRDTIHIESVQYRTEQLDGKAIAILTVSHFNGDTSAIFREKVNQVLLDQPDGIVLDLRNNAGGYLDAAIEIASQFLAEDTVVVYEQDASNEETPYLSSGPSPLSGREVVVLINAGSASASEILAGALHDHDQGVLVGTTSFGKGTVQDLRSFEDGSALKLTVARWLTPDHSLIEGRGIDPDFEVDRTPEDFSEDRDPQLDAATLFFTDRNAFTAQFPPYVPPAEPEVTDQPSQE